MAETGVPCDSNEISGDTDPLHVAATRDTYCFLCHSLGDLQTRIFRTHLCSIVRMELSVIKKFLYCISSDVFWIYDSTVPGFVIELRRSGKNLQMIKN